MASRAAGRPSSGVKGADVSRRQSGSPVDGGQRCVFSCLSLDTRGLYFSLLYTSIFFFFFRRHLFRFTVNFHG